MSLSEDKSSKSNLLINNQNNHSLSKDSCSFNTDISLLKAACFDNHLDGLVRDIGANLQCFETVLAVFIQFGQGVVYLINLAGGQIGIGNELSHLLSLVILYQDLGSAKAFQHGQQDPKLQDMYDPTR